MKAERGNEEDIVRVIVPFYTDGRAYTPGDVVAGLDEERAEYYARCGLVEIVPPPRRKPGPSTTKPKTGSKEEK